MKNRNTDFDNYMFYKNINTKELIAVEKRYIGKMDTLLVKYKEFINVPSDLLIEGFLFEVNTNKTINIQFTENRISPINELEPFIFIIV